MTPQPFLGVLFHWAGGLAAGSFYVPYRGVRLWAWEIYWIVGGIFSWIIAPWVLAATNTQDLLSVLREAPLASMGWAYFWGVLWGLGGLTFGLTMRYLGVSLGVGVALGYCAVFGTLMPPLFHGGFATKVLGTTSGIVILGGIVVCLAGILLAGIAGRRKEREMSEEEKRSTISEFNFTKGILVATFSGVMSACFAFGLDAAAVVADISASHGTPPLWTGLPKLCIVLLGGFTTNAIWCFALSMKNHTAHHLVARTLPSAPGSVDAPVAVPMLRNYLLCALAGVVWYFQFFFYSMGETQMGAYKFSSWTLHMASIIIFSSLWGIALHEWRGSSRSTRITLAIGLATLIFSTIIIGAGNSLGAQG